MGNDLSAYTYTIRHRPGKALPHADFLSRYAFSDPPETAVPSYFANPLPLDRNHLIAETRCAYGSVLAGLRKGWSLSAKKRFPELYAKRNDLSSDADSILLYNDQPVIPPTCRQAFLEHLHKVTLEGTK